jgi:adenosylcobinamide-GDP ribazoletransferase
VLQIKDWLDDLRTAIGFLTRIPVPHPDGPHPPNFARAHRLFPLVGAAIGTIIGLVCLALLATGIPPLAAAVLALGAGTLLTGALHEDGLGDLADGFGGGRDKLSKLEIMRDSRIGTYGTLILIVSFAAKAAALTAMPKGSIIPALMTAHALARGALSPLALVLPSARPDGLATSAGRPEPADAATSATLAVIVALLCLPWRDALLAAVAAALAASAIAFLSQRQIGGMTGDTFGAAEQCGEVAVLLLLAARLT